MQKIICIFVFCIGCFANAFSQPYFAKYMIFGTSLSYMRYTEKDFNYNSVGYSEFIWNTNIGLRVNKRLLAGMTLLNIYSSELYTPKTYYTVYGIFSQFNFLPYETNRLCAEISINKGNYFTNNDIPYQIEGLYYLGFGGAYDLPIKKIPNLFIDFSFMYFIILNSLQNKNGFSQSIIGLNYRFHER